MRNMCIAIVVMAILYGLIFIGAWKSELKVRLKSTTKLEKVGLMLTAIMLFVIAIITIAHNSVLPVTPTGYVLAGFADALDVILYADSSLILLVYFVAMTFPAIYLLAFSFRSLVEKYVRTSVPMFLLALIGVACISIYNVGSWEVADLFVLLLMSIVLFVYSSGVSTRLSKKCKILMIFFALVGIAVACLNLVFPFRAVVLVAEYAIAAAIIGWLWKKLRYFRKIWKAIAILIVLVAVILLQFLLFA